MENTSLSLQPVKIETSAVCQGCLSSGRILHPLKNNVQIFFLLLSRQTVLESKSTNISLCWECTANLRRVRKFQKRIQNAQLILQESQHLLDHSNSSLSTLSMTQSNTEIILKHEEIPKNVYDNNKPLNTDTTIDLKDLICKQENIYVDNYEDNCIRYSDTEMDNIKQEFTIENLKNEDKRRKKKNGAIGYKKYSHKAKITVNTEVDLNKPDDYYTKVYLSEKEIDEMVNRGISKKLRYSCKGCKRGYRSCTDLKRHKTFYHLQSKGPYACLECKMTFQTHPELLTHWDQHNYVFKCTVCGERMTQRNAILKHISVHGNIYTCVACQIRLYSSVDFSRHYKELHKRWTCDHCGQNFTNRNSILRHIRCHHTPHHCAVCDRHYKSHHTLKTHQRLSHPHAAYARVDYSLAYCVECDKQFHSVAKYKVHLNTAAVHTPPKKISVPCPECERVFSRKTYMNNHYKLVHSGKPKHYCSICDKYFVTAHSARKHQRHVHDKVPPPKNKICGTCGRGFSTTRILINHSRTHTGERPFRCARCPAAFAQQTALVTHGRSQHKHAIN